MLLHRNPWIPTSCVIKIIFEILLDRPRLSQNVNDIKEDNEFNFI
jgi:hypothetical protein